MRDLREIEIDEFLAQAEKLGQLMVHPAWDGWIVLLRGWTDRRVSRRC